LPMLLIWGELGLLIGVGGVCSVHRTAWCCFGVTPPHQWARARVLLLLGGLISADVYLSVHAAVPYVCTYILHFVCGGCWTQKILASTHTHTRIILGWCPLFVLLHIDIMSSTENTIARTRSQISRAQSHHDKFAQNVCSAIVNRH
jgi:hypothetical protein